MMSKSRFKGLVDAVCRTADRHPNAPKWLDEEPEPRECQCGEMMEPAKHFLEDLWLALPELCDDCQRKKEGEEREKDRKMATFERELEAAEIPPLPLKRADALCIGRKPHPFLDRFTKIDPNKPRVSWGVYIHGPTGTGKTVQACVALRLFLYRWIYQAGRHVTARYAHTERLMERTKRSFGGGDPVDWEAIEGCDLLVLDDLATERGTEFVAERIGGLVDYRYSHLRPTIFVSNVPIGELAGATTAYDDRTAGRIIEMCGGSHLQVLRLTERHRTAVS